MKNNILITSYSILFKLHLLKLITYCNICLKIVFICTRIIIETILIKKHVTNIILMLVICEDVAHLQLAISY